MEILEVIMAGGGGTRFWPLSRKKRPKQLLSIGGSDIMLNETIKRLDALIAREHVYVVTNEVQQALMKELILEGVPANHILAEPAARNTAPCVLYAAMLLQQEYEDCVMCVVPSDHHVGMPQEYQRVISHAIQLAEKSDCIVTIGLKPTFPATNFGYIRRGKSIETGAWQVEQFVEKPVLEKAEEYIASGRFYWNSGVFVFKISTIIENYKKYLPEMFQMMQKIMESPNPESALQECYPLLENISIDYGIMEKAEQVLFVEGDFAWSDVGCFDALDRVYPMDEQKNILLGKTIALNSRGCVVNSQEKLIALVGVEDLIVVESEDAILVCKKEAAQEVGKVVNALKEQGNEQYL